MCYFSYLFKSQSTKTDSDVDITQSEGFKEVEEDASKNQ